MNEQTIGSDRPAPRDVDELTADNSTIRRRRRLRLRHQSAVVVAELQRMRRVSWSNPAAEGSALVQRSGTLH